MLEAVGLMALGLVGLVLGGEFLVRGASRLAAIVGIPPLVIGLTVVAFGTSAPELAVSIKASLDGQADVAIGNVVGSNIFNVLCILGISALISPLIVSSQLIRRDVPLMIVASLAAFGLAVDGSIGRGDGIGLFAALVIYTVWTVVKSRTESPAVKEEFGREYAMTPPRSWSTVLLQAALIVGGLVLLTTGARWLVDGSVTIALLAGMSELLIGLTIVAAGTSLPEVATSVLATIRGERDIAVGNVIGSNIFNLLCVLGLTASVVPTGIAIPKTALTLDLPVMIAVAVATLPICFTGHRISRWEGGLFLGYYIAYTSYLILSATMPGLSRTFGGIMLGVVVPLTVITLLIHFLRTLRPAEAEG